MWKEKKTTEESEVEEVIEVADPELEAKEKEAADTVDVKPESQEVSETKDKENEIEEKE